MEKLHFSSDVRKKRLKKLSFFKKLGFLSIIIWFASLSAAADKPSEYRVKATFLYHFAQFTEWEPGVFESDNSPLMLCILGEDPFGDALKDIENKNIRGRPLFIRKCKDSKEISGCHILFVSPSEEGNLMNILSDIKDQPCLTVSDLEGFTQLGGIIKFFIMENKVRFEINPDAADRSRIKISSRLLKIADIFRE